MTALAGTVRTLRARPLPIAVGISTTLAIAYLIWQPATTDFAAQAFRADLWEREGFVIWNPDWYGGHTIPGYSLLFPPLGALVGPALIGAVSAVAASGLFARLALTRWGEDAWLGVVWFAFTSAIAVFSGRITFALGLALGLAALLAVQRHRAGSAGLAGALTAAASPVAGLFLLLACATVVLEDRFPLGSAGPGGTDARAGRPGSFLPAALAAAAAAAAVLGALVLAFPTEGFQPFTFDSFIWIPIVALVTIALVGRREGAILWAILLYLALVVVAFAIETPLGGNAIRLATTFAAPLLAILLLRRHPLLLALLAAPLLWWQWHTTVADVAATVGDESDERAYYEPLLGELERRNADGAAIRVRVPPTRSRGEAVHMPPSVMLDGGWLRQLESDDFDFLDRDVIGIDAYRSWVRRRGLSYVAVSDGEPDKLAEAERELYARKALVTSRMLWENEHWRLYRTASPARQPPPLVLDTERTGSGPDRTELFDVGPDAFSVRTDASSVVLDLRYTPYFEVVVGDACVEEAPAPHEGRTRLAIPANLRSYDPERRRTIRVEARLSLDGLLRRGGACRRTS